ncbi:hypothetical protein HDE_04494 [Halotydeus destructor]|nr:hypothetical protein HDE_04494 [Halotydeus destructor]
MSSDKGVFVTVASDKPSNIHAISVQQSFGRLCLEGSYNKEIFRCLSTHPLPVTQEIYLTGSYGKRTIKVQPGACQYIGSQLTTTVMITLTRKTLVSAILIDVTPHNAYSRRLDSLSKVRHYRPDNTYYLDNDVATLRLDRKICRLVSRQDYVDTLAADDLESQNILGNQLTVNDTTSVKRRRHFLPFICDRQVEFDHLDLFEVDDSFDKYFTKSIEIQLKGEYILSLCDVIVLSPKPFDCSSYIPDAPANGEASNGQPATGTTMADEMNNLIRGYYNQIYDEDVMNRNFVYKNVINCKPNFNLIVENFPLDHSHSRLADREQEFFVCSPEGFYLSRRYACAPKYMCDKFTDGQLENMTVSYSQEYYSRSDNRTLAISDGTKSTIAVFSCNLANHTLIGHRSISCDQNGWSGGRPFCLLPRIADENDMGFTMPHSRSNGVVMLVVIITLLFFAVIILSCALVITRRQLFQLQDNRIKMKPG